MAFLSTNQCYNHEKYSLIPFNQIRFLKNYFGFFIVFLLYLVLIFGYGNAVNILLNHYYEISIISCFILYNIALIMTIWSHITCLLSNPGFMPLPSDIKHYKSNGDSFDACAKCGANKPFTTHHCSVCNRCVYKMNHHCPWINNCIGIFNQKAFFLLLFYGFIQTIFLIALICIRIDFVGIDEFAKIFTTAYYELGKSRFVEFFFLFALLVFCLLFLCFTLFLLLDQFYYIKTNTLPIDHLKNLRGMPLGFVESLNQFYGCKFNWTWFVPITVYSPFVLSTVTNLNLVNVGATPLIYPPSF